MRSYDRNAQRLYVNGQFDENLVVNPEVGLDGASSRSRSNLDPYLIAQQASRRRPSRSPSTRSTSTRSSTTRSRRCATRRVRTCCSTPKCACWRKRCCWPIATCSPPTTTIRSKPRTFAPLVRFADLRNMSNLKSVLRARMESRDDQERRSRQRGAQAGAAVGLGRVELRSASAANAVDDSADDESARHDDGVGANDERRRDARVDGGRDCLARLHRCAGALCVGARRPRRRCAAHQRRARRSLAGALRCAVWRRRWRRRRRHVSSANVRPMKRLVKK